jgi:hypothetical protein
VETDAELKRDVAAELAWDPAVNASAVGVATRMSRCLASRCTVARRIQDALTSLTS